MILPELADWHGFYGIVGSAAATLVGLQFVAMTLIAARPPVHGAAAGAAFASPTIVHLCVVLLLAALSYVPWQTISSVEFVWGFLGFSGVIYAMVIVRRIRRQPVYRPAFEDWLSHAVLPFVAYAILAAASFLAAVRLREVLFGVGAAVLLLLFVGIHNAWDAVTYHVFEMKSKDKDKG